MLSLAGCGSKTDLMPLNVGRSWNYVTKTALDTYFGEVKVTRRVAVGGEEGYELAGPLGTSRLTWKNGQLLASETANARFIPALPILDARGEDVKWHGRMETAGQVFPASAHVSQKKDKIQVAGRDVEATLSTVVVSVPQRGIELETWFEPGVGVVQQEQRINRVLTFQTQMLEGLAAGG